MVSISKLVANKLPNEIKSYILSFKTFTPENRDELYAALCDWEYDKASAIRKYGHVSGWDVSRVRYMNDLFRYLSDFNDDISKWNVSNVINMSGMFYGSKFNGDISKWNVKKVKNMFTMFYHSDFNGDISKWNVKKVDNMSYMFGCSRFTGDISSWKPSSKIKKEHMFICSTMSMANSVPRWV